MLDKRKWVWPAAPKSTEEISIRLGVAQAENIDYNKRPILGFPGTSPLPQALEAMMQFLPTQANNIGLHTLGEPAELGFQGTQDLEMEYVYSLASLLGSHDPETDVDGYITNGGTEGNDHGMWLGRNWLWVNVTPREVDQRGIVVITSFLTHYSIEKEFNRLLGAEHHGTAPASPNVLRIMPTDENGQLSCIDLESEIREYFLQGYRRFLIFLTAGTTNLGSIDPVAEVNTLLSALEAEFCQSDEDTAGFYVHVDAAYGGLVIPFVHPNNEFGFQNSYVQSISVDAHKMGFVPYSAGVFLCRKDLLELTKTEAKYLPSHKDYTVPGSRSGSIAAACWTSMHSLGFVGHRKILDECMELTEYLRRELSHEQYRGKIKIFPSELNILTISPEDEVARAMTHERAKGQPLFKEYFVVPIPDFPRDLTKPFGRGKVSCTAYRFVLMPHCHREDIDRFVTSLQENIRSL